MLNICDGESKTQNNVVNFFRTKLHYTYLGNPHDRENGNIMPDLLRTWLLKRGCFDKLADMPSMR